MFQHALRHIRRDERIDLACFKHGAEFLALLYILHLDVSGMRVGDEVDRIERPVQPANNPLTGFGFKAGLMLFGIMPASCP